MQGVRVRGHLPAPAAKERMRERIWGWKRIQDQMRVYEILVIHVTMYTCPKLQAQSSNPSNPSNPFSPPRKSPPVSNCLARIWWENKFRQQGYMIRGICPPGKSLRYYHVVCAVRV